MAGPPYNSFQLIDINTVGVNASTGAFSAIQLNGTFNPADNRIRCLTTGGKGFRGITGKGGGGGPSGCLTELLNWGGTPLQNLVGKVSLTGGTTGASGGGACFFGSAFLTTALVGSRGPNSSTDTFAGQLASLTDQKGTLVSQGNGGGGNTSGNATGRGGGGGGGAPWTNAGGAALAPSGTDGTDGGTANGGATAGGTKGTAGAAAGNGIAGTPPVYAGSGGGGASTANSQGGNGGSYGSGGGGGYDGTGIDSTPGGGLILIEWNVNADSITQTELPLAHNVRQRIPATAPYGTSAPVTMTGTCTGTNIASVTSIEIQLTKITDGTVVQAWTALTGLSYNTSTGAYSGSLSVPATAMMYNYQTRSKAGGTVLATSGMSSNILGCGIVWGADGSSTQENFQGTVTGTPTAAAYTYCYIRTVGISQVNHGCGQVTFANVISAANGGLPVMFVNSGDGGALLTGAAGWADATSTVFTTSIANANSNGGKLEGVICCALASGDARTNQATSQLKMYNGFVDYVANKRAALGQPTLPIFPSGMQMAPLESNDDQWDYTNRAVYQVCANIAGVYLGCIMNKCGLDGDNIHPNGAELWYAGAAMAKQAANALYGASNPPLGPVMLSSPAPTYDNATGIIRTKWDRQLRNALNNGTLTIEPLCFQVTNAALVAQTVSAASIDASDGTVINVTVPAGLGAGVQIGYEMGAHPGTPFLPTPPGSTGVPTAAPNCVFDGQTPPYP